MANSGNESLKLNSLKLCLIGYLEKIIGDRWSSP